MGEAGGVREIVAGDRAIGGLRPRARRFFPVHMVKVVVPGMLVSELL
jgi:hypothetical protein